MRIITCNNYENMGQTAAILIASQLIENPQLKIGLATGSTPVSTYQELVHLYNQGIISFEQAISFNLDEYCCLDENHEQSYHYFMKENLFKHVDIKDENIFIPNGIAKDMQEECNRYEGEIEKAGGVDVQLLGLGRNGHIGFNEPEKKGFPKYTHEVVLTEDTIDANKRFFDKKDDVPTKAITMGVGTIMKAKKVILLANGENKATAVQSMINGEVNPLVPASALQMHQNLTIILDKEAAKLI